MSRRRRSWRRSGASATVGSTSRRMLDPAALVGGVRCFAPLPRDPDEAGRDDRGLRPLPRPAITCVCGGLVRLCVCQAGEIRHVG